MAQLSLSFLGSFQVHRAGQPVTGFKSLKVRALLAYLSLQAEQPHRREALAGLLWPELPEERARHNLRVALNNLRQLLGEDGSAPFLLVTRDALQFNPASDYTLDVTTFTRLLASCQAHGHRRLASCAPCLQRLQQAASLYRGDLLQDFFLSDSPAFEEWALVERERLHQLALTALERLVAAYTEWGEYNQARDYAVQMLRVAPWQEEAHRQLMHLYMLLGQRSAALVQYERCQRVLAEELGVEPSAETTQLYEQLLTSDGGMESDLSSLAPRARAARTNLPVALNRFIGRDAELEQLGELVQDAQCRLVTLVGPGGIGKTRLAIEVAAAQAASFPDGVFFVALAPLSDSAAVLPTIAETLGVQEAGGQPLMEVVKSYLRDKELLLLLDNFEHLLAAAPLVSELLQAAPGVAVLATSREALHLYGEQEFVVEPLALPETGPLPPLERLSQVEAVALFVQRAQAVKRDFRLTAANAPAVAEICVRLDGLPLAIELAAARVNLFSPQLILTYLDKRLEWLSARARDVPPRHRTLRAAIAWSYALLSPAEQVLLRRLAVFAGGWMVASAQTVCDLADDLAVGVWDELSSLVDKSLVRQVEGVAGEPRFLMLETIREYAAEQLQAAGERELVHDRHLHHFLDLAERAEAGLAGAEQLAWLDRLEAEHNNLRAALAWSLSRPDTSETSVRLAGALGAFWWRRGHLSEGRQWLERALAQQHEASPYRAKALTALGALAAWQFDDARHSVALQESVALYRALGDKRGLAEALLWLRWEAERRGDTATAYAIIEESVALYREVGDRWGLANALWFQGWTATQQSEYRLARRLYEESIALFQETGDRWSLALLLAGLGFIAYREHDYDRARVLYEESLALWRESGNKTMVAITLNNLAEVVRTQADYVAAAMRLEESVALWREMDGAEHLVIGLLNLGYVRHRLQDAQRAATLFRESLILAYQLDYESGIALALIGMAGLVGADAQEVESAQRAARLLGAADALLERNAIQLEVTDLADYQRNVAMVRAKLDEIAFTAAWMEGQAMTLAQAIDYALAEARAL